MKRRLTWWVVFGGMALVVTFVCIVWAITVSPRSPLQHAASWPAKGAIPEAAAPESSTSLANSLTGASPDATAGLALLTRRSSGNPSFEEIGCFTANDEPRVLSVFLATSWTNRRSSIWTLARIGGERSAKVLEEAISGGTVPPTVSLEEERVMHLAALALGFISARDDSAYSYLTNRMRPESWEHRRSTLASERLQAGFGPRRLAGAVIKGVAISGRPQVPAILESLKGDAGILGADLSGSLGDAAFFYDYVSSYGHDALLRDFLNYQIGHRFRTWRETTENGKAWWAWFVALNGRRPPSTVGNPP